MLGIQSISYACGDLELDNFEAAARLGREKKFIEEKIGFTTLRRLAPKQTTIDLCKQAYASLCADLGEAPEIDCLVAVSQSYGGEPALPHLSAKIHGELNLPVNVAAFDIGLGCSGFVYALNVVTAFMEHNGMKRGLLITADAYSPVLQPEDVNTQLLFGDAAAVTLISDTPRYYAGKTTFATEGKKASALMLDRELGLQMNGRDIFNFSMTHVPEQILRCLDINGLSPETVDCVLLHQASKFIVESIPTRVKVPPQKTPFLLSDIGNCVSSTLPIALARTMDNNHKTCLLSGFGVGLSWASTVLFRA